MSAVNVRNATLSLRTLLKLFKPDLHGYFCMFSMMNQPQRNRLYTLLGVGEVGELFLQCRRRKGRHVSTINIFFSVKWHSLDRVPSCSETADGWSVLRRSWERVSPRYILQ